MDSDRSSRSRSSFNASELILPELKLRFKGFPIKLNFVTLEHNVITSIKLNIYFCFPLIQCETASELLLPEP